MAEQVELELKIKGGNKAVKTLGQLEQELDKAREAIKGVEVGSKAFETLAQKIQKTGSEIKVLEKNMESLEPQQKAEAFLKLGEGIAGGFAVGQGAMALMGVESENLEKIQVKVQSAIAIAQGIRMMSEAALMATTAKRVLIEKTSLVTTKLMSVATATLTFIQGGLATSITATSVALAALRVAILATGIGALVVGIGAAVGYLSSWISGTEEQTKVQKINTEALQKQNKALIDNARNIESKMDAEYRLLDAQTEADKELEKRQQFLEKEAGLLDEAIARVEKNNSLMDEYKDKDWYAEWYNTNADAIKSAAAQLEDWTQDVTDAKTAVREQIVAMREAEKQAKKDEEAAEKRQKRREKRKQKRIKDAADLASLEKELDLMRIEDDNERAAAKIEQDRQRDLEAAVGQEEQIALIKEKYNILEAEREDAYWEKKIADNNAYNQKIADDAIAIKEKQAAKQKEIDQLVEDTKANMISQGFELAKTLGGKNKKIQKGIAVSETIFNTQKSIMRALADIPAPYGVAQAVVHGAMGAAAIGTILSESTGEVTTGGGSTPEPMIPQASGAFTLGGGDIEQQAMRAYVVTDEMSDSQAQLADIRRRSTI